MSRRSKKEAGPGKAPSVHSSASAFPAGEMPGAADSLAPASESCPVDSDCRWITRGVCIFLVAITLAVFGRTLRHGFVKYDDSVYVVKNAAVTRGLNLQGIRWAFTHIVLANWHPLTMISHMLDCSLYGLNAGGHHLTNVLLHAATATLLFFVLRRMMGLRRDHSRQPDDSPPKNPKMTAKTGIAATTPQPGITWRSAFVAAVFAIHPLRAESVAWVAERKDVLSGLFFMLTLMAYLRYVRNQSWLRYLAVLGAFALGLMSKPMLVTLPFVLLLLDYWPLRRFEPTRFLIPGRLLLEKVPLLTLAAVFCAVTLRAQEHARQFLPLADRLANAMASYVVYLRQMFWPVKLAVFYPYPAQRLSTEKIIGTALILIAISAAAGITRRKQPYLLTGWLWYLGMLVPVIGLVQVGFQAHADRYTYLPQIGLYLALTWLVADLTANWRGRRLILGAGAAASLAVLTFAAWKQAGCWRDTETLWIHAIASTSNNAIAHSNLGAYLIDNGKFDAAIIHCEQALAINPNYADAHDNLGCGLLKKGDVDAAIVEFNKALVIKPQLEDAHINLSLALLKNGNVDEAMVHYQKALEIKPDNLEAHNNLVWVLATSPQASSRNGNKAVELAQQANQMTGGENPDILRTLAAAYAEAGRFGDAIRSAQKAMELARTAGRQDLAGQLNGELKLYRAGLPFHQESK